MCLFPEGAALRVCQHEHSACLLLTAKEWVLTCQSWSPRCSLHLQVMPDKTWHKSIHQIHLRKEKKDQLNKAYWPDHAITSNFKKKKRGGVHAVLILRQSLLVQSGSFFLAPRSPFYVISSLWIEDWFLIKSVNMSLKIGPLETSCR